MKPKLVILTIFSALAALLFTACSSAGSSAANATSTAVPVVVDNAQIVVEGRIVPRESVQIAFTTSGQVAEVLVKEGDVVKAGDVVARIGNQAELESAVANAELELLNANLALEKLSDDLPQDQTEALQALKDARKAVRDAEQRLRGFDIPSEPLDIEVARANVALAKKALDKAKKDYQPWEKERESNLIRASHLSKLRDAQERYDDEVQALNRLTGVITPAFDLDQAQTELRIAEERLRLAQEKHDLLLEGSDPDEVAAAEGRINTAEAALTSAKSALDKLELKATIDGTIVEQDLVAGQQVTAGQSVMRIADFSQLYVETDDLTEIDVVDIAEGQSALVIPDALPEVEINGTVESISQTFEEKRGDITYTVRILLDGVDAPLRWGMTVEVTFEEQ